MKEPTDFPHSILPRKAHLCNFSDLIIKALMDVKIN